MRNGTSYKTLPPGWAIATLQDVAHWGSGGTPSRKFSHFYEGDIPWIKTGELGRKYIRNSEEHISEEAIRKSSARIFPAGSVGIAMYGATIGKLSIWGIDASTNQACAVGQPYHRALSNEFLYYFLLSEKRGLIDAGKGGAQPNISQGILKAWPIWLPPLNEQRRIVAKIEALFSELDKGVESLKTAREQLKVYRQAVLKHAFEGKLTAQWREENKDKLEFPEQLLDRIRREREDWYQQQVADWKAAVKEWEAKGESGKKPAKPSHLKPLEAISTNELHELSPLPYGWSYARLGDFVDAIEAGKSFKCDEREPLEHEIGVAKVSAVTWGEYDESESKTCVDPSKENADYFIKSGDFLLSRANTIELVGACVIAKKVTRRIMLSDKTLRIRFGSGNKAYFLHYLRGHTGRNEIMKRSTGNQESMRNIGQDRVRSIIVPVCSNDEMAEIVGCLEKTFAYIEAMETGITGELKRSESLRQSILKKAFSGQLVSQDPNDEPASVLLERIKAEKAQQIDSRSARNSTRKTRSVHKEVN